MRRHGCLFAVLLGRLSMHKPVEQIESPGTKKQIWYEGNFQVRLLEWYCGEGGEDIINGSVWPPPESGQCWEMQRPESMVRSRRMQLYPSLQVVQMEAEHLDWPHDLCLWVLPADCTAQEEGCLDCTAPYEVISPASHLRLKLEETTSVFFKARASLLCFTQICMRPCQDNKILLGWAEH